MLAEQVIAYFGGITATAAKLGITRAAVNQWGKYVPVTAAFLVQRESGGKFRPDPKLYASLAEAKISKLKQS